MFRALVAHPQEAQRKRYLVYCVRVLSVGCTRVGVELVSKTPVPLEPWCNILSAVCVAPPEDKEVMLGTCRGP
jgi:hypothetical protein